MLEITTLICRTSLAATQTLTSPESKGINIPVIQAGLWNLNPKITTNWPSKGQSLLHARGTSLGLVLGFLLQCQHIRQEQTDA